MIILPRMMNTIPSMTTRLTTVALMLLHQDIVVDRVKWCSTTFRWSRYYGARPRHMSIPNIMNVMKIRVEVAFDQEGFGESMRLGRSVSKARFFG